MDFGKINSKVRDFDLNISYVEDDFDLNSKNEFPSVILMDTQQASHNSIENMNKEDANKVDNEVHQSFEVDTVPVQANSAAGVTSEVDPKYNAPVSFAPVRITKRRRSPSHHVGFTPVKMNIEDASKRGNEVHQSSKVDTTIETNSCGGATSEEEKHDEPKYIASASFASVRITPQRRRRRSSGREVQQSTDSEIFCTNYFCKTRETPMWRKGPLGPRTLCNACGLQYVKMVKGKGSGKPAAVPCEGDASTANYHDGASPDAVPASNVSMSAD